MGEIGELPEMNLQFCKQKLREVSPDAQKDYN